MSPTTTVTDDANLHRRREDTDMNTALVYERDLVRERESDGVAAPARADRDHDLVHALRQRDPLASECLVARYGDRAYRLASGITGSGQDAEEVVQDAFWTVVRKIDTFRNESAFRSWLYRIVANAAIHKRRAHHSRARDIALDEVLPVFDEHGRHAAPVDDWSPRAADPSRRADLRTALTEAIDDLSAAYRVPLLLRDVEGQSIADIAEALGLNRATVKIRVHRARL